MNACLSLVLDADLRFALENPGDRDIAKRCLIYIHKVVNAKGERGRGEEKEEVKSHLQRLSQSEVKIIHHFLGAFIYLYITITFSSLFFIF